MNILLVPEGRSPKNISIEWDQDHAAETFSAYNILKEIKEKHR